MSDYNKLTLLSSLVLTCIVITWLKNHKALEKLNDEASINKETLLFSNYTKINRQLSLTKSYYAEICIKIDKKNPLGYDNALTGTALTIEGYISNLTYYTDKYNLKLKAAIIDENDNERNALITEILSPFAVLIACAVVTIISWIVYCGCCCRPCGCCSADTKDEACCGVKGLSLIMLTVSIIGVAVVCIIGWIFSAKLSPATRDLECSLIRFYTDITEGEEKTSIPRWDGIQGISEKFKDIGDALDEVQRNSETFYQDNSDVKNSKEAYYKLLDDKYSENKDRTASNPNPESSSTKISPSFIQKLGPSNSEGSTLWSLKSEFNITILATVQSLEVFEYATQGLTENVDETKNTFYTVSTDIGNLNQDISKFDTDYIGVFQDNVSKLKLYFFLER